jgi:hypothetical protein
MRELSPTEWCSKPLLLGGSLAFILFDLVVIFISFAMAGLSVSQEAISMSLA